MIVERAERVRAHDRCDHEHDHGALAAVAFTPGVAATVEEYAGAKDQNRGHQLDHAPGGHGGRHRLKNPQLTASVTALAKRSSTMRPSTTAPAPLAIPRTARARFIGSPLP